MKRAVPIMVCCMNASLHSLPHYLIVIIADAGKSGDDRSPSTLSTFVEPYYDYSGIIAYNRENSLDLNDNDIQQSIEVS